MTLCTKFQAISLTRWVHKDFLVRTSTPESCFEKSGFYSPGNMKFTGVLPFTRLENSRRAMACDPEKFFLSMFKTLHL